MSEAPTPVKELTYNQAFAELDSILKLMQSDQCDIDRLATLTRRATELIGECRSRLTATDDELKAILAQLEN
jgi:exodeoxyribonuclease VII small subunit